MVAFHTIRFVVYVIVLVFSVIELGLSAHLVILTRWVGNIYFKFSGLGIACSSLTIISLPILLLLSDKIFMLKPWALADIATTTVLWILWLSTSADASTVQNISQFNNLSCDDFTGDVKNGCGSFKSFEALSYSLWLLLMLYSFLHIAYYLSRAKYVSGDGSDDDPFGGMNRSMVNISKPTPLYPIFPTAQQQVVRSSQPGIIVSAPPAEDPNGSQVDLTTEAGLSRDSKYERRSKRMLSRISNASQTSLGSRPRGGGSHSKIGGGYHSVPDSHKSSSGRSIADASESFFGNSVEGTRGSHSHRVERSEHGPYAEDITDDDGGEEYSDT